jgi:hypothetical protein
VEGNFVTCGSKKQFVVAKTSAEAEFRANIHGLCEMLWLKIMYKELGGMILKIPCGCIVPMKLQFTMLTIQSNITESSMLRLRGILLK